MKSGRVVTTQVTENVWKFENDWGTDLSDCCTDIGDCCCAFWCLPCYTCKLFSRTEEFMCTPLFVPMSLMAFRTKLRTGFRIKGSICMDCLITYCCPCCAVIQMKNELNKQGL